MSKLTRMTNLDEFESVFRAADKETFEAETIQLDTVSVVCDLDEGDAAKLVDDIQALLGKVPGSAPKEWKTISQFGSVKELVDEVTEHAPNLVCTYRNLQIPATEFPYSLGVYIDVLTQATPYPILLLPHPQTDTQWPQHTNNVLAITDHLAGDHHLVSFSSRLTASEGSLVLAHLEDENELERYMQTISRIPAIDTDDARAGLEHQLLKEPTDYIESCRAWLDSHRADLNVAAEVSIGHRLEDCRRLIADHNVDLVVMNTKDADQMAMHGLAYPIAVELRETPLLLL